MSIKPRMGAIKGDGLELKAKAQRLLDYLDSHRGKQGTIGDMCQELKTTPRTLIKSYEEIEVAISKLEANQNEKV